MLIKGYKNVSGVKGVAILDPVLKIDAIFHSSLDLCESGSVCLARGGGGKRGASISGSFNILNGIIQRPLYLSLVPQ